MSSFETALDASVTVQRRMALLSQAAAEGRLLAEPEFWRMGPEKMMAAAEGFTAASIAAASHWPHLAMDPSRLSAMSLAVAHEATRPARTACRANARRLGRKTKRK
jgi:hypothetical protein